MKLYLSSYRIPTPDTLASLIGKSLSNVTVALIPNAKDYYSQRAWEYKVGDFTNYLEALGLHVSLVDLRKYSDKSKLMSALSQHDLVWAMGGNTFCLRYEMRRSGFESVISSLLMDGMVYGGDSAGALVAGTSINGIESADVPEFADKVIEKGLNLVPYIVLPHVDNPGFEEAVKTVRELYQGTDTLIELNDSQAVVFEGGKHKMSEAA